MALGTLFFLFAPSILGLFTESLEIRNLGVSYLRVIVLSYPFIAVSMLAGRSLQGMGLGFPVMILTTLRVLLISAPLALLAQRLERPIEWVWAAIVAGTVATSVLALAWLRAGLRGMASATTAGEAERPSSVAPAEAAVD